ncbi:MAG: HEAT repeat domain-containing protein [Planctomycetes bacterium]|nr:HEAT repeat domain-containing protein [Planctomycetota bacterium]
MRHPRIARTATAVLAVACLLACHLASPPPAAATAKRDRDQVRKDRVVTLIARLGSQEKSTRVRAARILAQVGDESAFAALERCLGDAETEVRVAAIDALGRLHASADFEVMLGLLDDSEEAVQEAAAEALGRLGNAKAIEPLVAKLPKAPGLWVEVAEALGVLGDRKNAQTVHKILLAVKEAEDQARVAAALGKLVPAPALEVLEAVYKLKAEDLRPRIAALLGAGEMNQPQGAQFLAEKLRRMPPAPEPGEEDALRDALANGLGRLRDRKLFVQILDELRQDTDPRRLLRNRATWLLGIGRAGLGAMEEDVLKALQDPDDSIRLAAIEALGGMRSAKAVAPLLALLDDKAFEVQVAALDALGEIGDFECVPAVAAKLAVGDPRLRFAAAYALYKIRSDDVVEPILGAMAGSKEWLLLELASLLRDLTGKDFGPDAKAWQEWWSGVKGSFRVHYEEDNLDFRATVLYHGIEVNSDRVAFCLDISGSMEWPDTSREAVVYTDAPGQARKRRRKKIEVAKEELIKTIKALKPNVRFALWVYSFDPRSWKKDTVPATEPNKDEAVKFVEKVATGGGTNIFDTLDKCFSMAGPGVNDPKADMKVDTIFLLTDGSPNRGRFPEPRQILSKVAEMNRLGRMRIHTIGVGDEQNVAFLRKLAAQNGGRYVRR